MTDLHGAEPLQFDNGTADALISELTSSAGAVEGQSGSRASYVHTASEEFAGHFSDLFAQNATTASGDASEIASQLRLVAGWVRQLKTAAAQENARRRRAREWQEEHDHRNVFEQVGDFFTGGDQPPTETPKHPPVFQPAAVTTGTRQTPSSGSGSSGGTSSAKPENLRAFATGSAALDSDLAGRPGALRGKLADFASRCQWGSIDASGLAAGFDRWLAANAQDVQWAKTIADAFAAAGGEGSVSTVADSALAAALQAAGVSAERSDLAIDPPRAYGAQPTSGYSMDPVNTTTGNFLEPEVDVAFGGASATLRLSRMYNSLDQRSGVFGLGWASTLETRLEIDDEGASFFQADGRLIRFPRLGAAWERAIGENFWLASERDPALIASAPAGDSASVSDPAEVLVVRDNEGSWWFFSPSGTWLGSGSGAGTALRAERDGDGRVGRILHARGRFVDVDYAGGRVAVLRASDGRRVEFAYDGAGRLTGATTEVGTRSYGWNEAGLIATVTSAAGVVEAANEYDDLRRVTRQISPHGRTVRFAYLPGRVTVVSDDDGSRSNSWISDARGRLVGIVDADDQRQSMSYDAHGNLVSATERDGATTVHAYDARGRRIRTVTPSGGDLTYGYDDLDRVTTVVTESGSVVTYEYAGSDRDPSLVVDPEGGRSELHWRDGLLDEVVDPTGVRVRLAYDEHGELVSTTNALGDVARIERDAAGHPVVAVSPSGARTSFRYDAAGLLISRQDPDGAVWRFEHGVAGRVTAVVDPLGARTTFEYGANGELTTTVDPLGRVEARVFDDQGDLAAVRLPDGAEWLLAHDALSRLRSITDPSGAVWRREYDVTGELTALVDPTGVRQDASADVVSGVATLHDAFDTTTVRFDEYGRPTSVASLDGSSELTTYDLCGRPVELLDGEGGLTRLDRDAAGRVVAITTPSGACTTYEYDACGRPSAGVDPVGARIELAYDADSRVVARTLASGDVQRFAYDAVGRLITRTTPGEGTARFSYDAVGRLTSSRDSRFGHRRFRYDAAGQLIEAVNGLGGVTGYAYDVRGRLVSITDPLGGVTRRSYDDADRVTSVTDPLGRTTSAEYDAAGRILLQRDPDGRSTTWTYDEAGQQSTVSVDGRLRSVVARDARSRTLVVTDHTLGDGRALEHELCFDRRGLLIRRARGDRAMSWEYDADGARIARVDPDGTRIDYRRDAVGRAVAIERAGLDPASFVYDVAGRLVQASTGDTVQSWSYVDGPLVAHTITTPEGADVTRIERDDEGRITAVSRPEGRVAYGHDAAGQLVRVDASGGSTSTWTYDLAGRLVAEMASGVELRHAYDAAGQLLGTVDLRSGERVDYVHDGLGRRIRRTASDGSTTDYAWSDLGYLRSVVSRDASYELTGRNDIRVDVLGELADVSGAETWWDTSSSIPSLVSLAGTSLLDLPGGVAAIGDSWTNSGWRAARATDESDPWAMLEATVGILPGLSLPAGVSLGAGGGLIVAGLDWLGARAYDAAARGFLSTDPLDGVVGAAWSGNPYAYAGNDPLHAVDPLGLRPATDADLKAYRDAHQGAFAAVGNWADDHADLISKIAIGVGIGLTIAAMFTPLGPVVAIAVMAGAGAALSGGLSIQNNTGENGKVDWGRVGVDTLIGGASGAAGGGAALGLTKLAPTITRLGAPLVQRATTQIFSTAGRSAMSAGSSGLVSNTATYATDPRIATKTAAGYATSAMTGFGFGAGFSLGGGKVGSFVSGKLELPAVASTSPGRHALIPDTSRANNLVTGAFDHLAGGVGSVINEWSRPGGDQTADNLLQSFGTGSLSGAGGPTLGLHAAP